MTSAIVGVVRYEHGPISYKVGAAIARGQLVIPWTTNTKLVAPAGDGALNVLGMALQDAIPEGTSQNYSASGLTPMAYNLAPLPNYVDAASEGHVAIKCTTNVARGQKVVAAAGGLVRAFVNGTDTVAMIVGRSTDHEDRLANAAVLIKMTL